MDSVGRVLWHTFANVNTVYIAIVSLGIPVVLLYILTTASRKSTEAAFPAKNFSVENALPPLLPKSASLGPPKYPPLRASPASAKSPTSPTSPTSHLLNAPLVHYTPAEIASFGDFPDYASLTGVPLPDPYPEFNIATAKPRPYRPFRWAYHQTMSLTKMEPNWWLELEDTYKERIDQRKRLFEEYGDKIIQALPGTELASKELMEMVVQFLCARYPQYFSLSTTSANGKNIYTLHNKILEQTFEVNSMDPLHVIFYNVPEDFIIVMKDDLTEKYTFKAGVICSSIGWDVSTKIGKELAMVHTPVPEYKEKMAMSMDRYFSKMPTNKPIQRGSWGLEIDQPLFVPPGSPLEHDRTFQSPSLQESSLHLRVDWQTLRRLPLSNAIVFNYKALFTPMSEFADEPGIPALVGKVVKEGNKKIMEYKGTWHVEHVALPMLERMGREQIERGIWEEGREVKTMDESPFYKGWEEKWHRQQGF
ncbi:hypothetical protein ABW19_dt0204581 [Dactylella cylindrospora]|nr:hypothetical protein ABW19_dt0204581 [Dactylella cylindrospora]